MQSHADPEFVYEDTSPIRPEIAPWGRAPRPDLQLVPTGAVVFATFALDRPTIDLVPMPAGGTAGPGGRPRPDRPVRTAIVHGAEWLLGR